MRNRAKKMISCIVVSFFILFCFVVVMIASFSSCNSNLSIPRISIKLNGVSLEQIGENEKDVKYANNGLTVFDGAREIVRDDVEIKGHGNTTWQMDKKSYRIKFDKSINMLGLGKAKKWILIANSPDYSLLRNDVAFYVNRLIGGDNALDGRHVELFVDDDYLGVYYLTKAIDVGKDNIRLYEKDGVLVEVDNIYCDGEITYWTKWHDCLSLKDVVNDDIEADSFRSFASDFERMEEYARKGMFDSFCTIADAESFAEYFLISEFTNNPDSFSTSWWLYRDGMNEKIRTGPAWDFDLALGNRNWGESGKDVFHNPQRPLVQRESDVENEKRQSYVVSKLMYFLMDIPKFRELVNNIYQQRLMGKKEEIIEYLDRQSIRLRDAAIANQEKWDGGSYEDEVLYLKWWVDSRLRMMDVEYGETTLLPTTMREI